jgi:hypothetical protein
MKTADKSKGGNTINSNRTSSLPSGSKSNEIGIKNGNNFGNVIYKKYVDNTKGKSTKMSGISTKVFNNIYFFLL